MTKIRWGVLSTAKIAREHMIPAIQSSALGELVAIASRAPEPAKAQAEKLGIERSHSSYEALLDDPDVDAIYIPLPNHLHVPWSIKALQAGKHVLVEKPAALHRADLEPLLATATRYPDLLVMEAFMYRFHPQWVRTLELLDSIGPVRAINCLFSYNNREAANIRNSAAMGGGALMDIGCYGISLARFVYGAEPLRVTGEMNWLGHEVDCVTTAILRFAEGTATFTCSTKTEGGQWVEIIGETGSLRLPIPFNPIADQPTLIERRRQRQREDIVVDPANHYRAMADAFAAAVIERKPAPTPLSDALENMRIIDAIVEGATEHRWVHFNQ